MKTFAKILVLLAASTAAVVALGALIRLLFAQNPLRKYISCDAQDEDNLWED